MKQNIGKNDKIARIVIAAAFAVIGYMYSHWFYIVTAALIITVATGFCLPYKWLGINTAKKKK